MLIYLRYLQLPGTMKQENSQILENDKMILSKAITETHSAVKIILNLPQIIQILHVCPASVSLKGGRMEDVHLIIMYIFGYTSNTALSLNLKAIREIQSINKRKD